LKPDIRVLHNRHRGETCLIVANGPSLAHLPLDLLTRYPSIGCNTLVEWPVLTPTYYVAVDARVREEFGKQVAERYTQVPKLLPVPNLEGWCLPMVYHWFHRPGRLWPYTERMEIRPDWLMNPGITWLCCPHAQMQIAMFLGFSRLLIVGMDHSDNRKMHAWGEDTAMPGPTDSVGWWEYVEQGHAQLLAGLALQGVEIINITPGTAERVFPRGDWRDWM